MSKNIYFNYYNYITLKLYYKNNTHYSNERMRIEYYEV